MAHFGEPRPCFLSKLYDNVINTRNGQQRMGLLFIEDSIFLVKKFFWTKFKKLASERNFDLEQKIIFFELFVSKLSRADFVVLSDVCCQKVIIQRLVTELK